MESGHTREVAPTGDLAIIGSGNRNRVGRVVRIGTCIHYVVVRELTTPRYARQSSMFGVCT
jgi:hypothetical protein